MPLERTGTMPLTALCSPATQALETVPKPHKNIGSFRDSETVLTTLPADIAKLRDPDIDWKKYTLDTTVSHLNHAAFGGVPQEYADLETALRKRADRNPSLFYDTLCVPLIRESIAEAEAFFNGTVILQPNCTSALKNIITALGECSVACLSPVYGATRQLLTHTHPGFVDISPGMFCESEIDIINTLESTFQTRAFGVLVADHVTSQTGRILPMAAIVRWCRAHSVISVIDGTQACAYDHEIWPDYYVLSTHKWLCNIKTCCVIRLEKNAIPPEPIGISFGYTSPTDRHVWTGMLDYMPYILLAKALRVYRKHGQDMVQYAAQLLHDGLRKYVGKPVLPMEQQTDNVLRTFAMVPVRRTERDLQASMEQFGLFVSVKNLPVDAATFGSQCFIRVSAWCYNSLEDFRRLGEFLNYSIRIDDCLGATPAEKSQRMRLQLMEAVDAQFDMTEALYEQLSVEAYFTRAESLRHPLIFYYGHTAVFFMNKLVLGMYLSQEDRIDPELESLCAVGVDEMSWDDLNVGQWDKVPQNQQANSLKRVKRYRGTIRSLLRSMITDPTRELSLPILQDSIWWVFLMGIEHDRIHFETSQVIMAQLPQALITAPSTLWDIYPTSTDRTSNSLASVPLPPLLSSSPSAATATTDGVNKLITVSGGSIQVGRSAATTTTYGWDNEFGKGKVVNLSEFQVSETLVSHAEYAVFVHEGGYQKQEYWSEDGWQWAQTNTKPLFWKVSGVESQSSNKSPSDDERSSLSHAAVAYRSLLEEIDVPADWPVVVNNYEGEAFCAWKSKKLGKHVRMISHPEWFLLSKRAQSVDYNINFRMGGGPCSVRKCGEPLGKKGEMVFDIRGNVWQHSRSLLTVPPEFQVHPLYDDFTLPTIDGHHNFILGGSWASVGNAATIDSRYGFRRHFYQFAGIRYVCSDNEDLDVPARLIRGEVAMRLDEDYEDFNDPVALSVTPVRNGMEAFGQFAAQYVPVGSSVIVLNGSVGRITTEIVTHSKPKSVLHTDPTANTLDAFLYFLKHSTIRFERTIEGNISRTECIDMKPEWISGFAATDVSVKQLDLFRMSQSAVSPHDVAVLNLAQLSCMNCPCRGTIPRNLSLLVKPGGVLIVLRPLAENRQDGVPLVIDGFVSVSGLEVIPHISRETRRKHRFAESQCCVFRRTGDTVYASRKDSGDLVTPCPEYQYEQNDVLRSYENFHYAFDTMYGIPNFPVNCASLCLEACKKHNVPLINALDAGCGPGRLGIELSSSFENVISFDLSPHFIPMLETRRPGNLTAFVADALDCCCDTRIASRKYNLIVGANVLDRLADPRQWIMQCKELLEDNGLFVLFSPFTWMQEYTDESKWLGGVRVDAEVVWSLRGVVNAAGPDLVLCDRASHIPFIIPDGDGSMQYTLSQCMVFCKRNRLMHEGAYSIVSPGEVGIYVDDGEENYTTPRNQ